MCSILGQFSNSIDVELFKKANEMMKHRGPDNSGYYLDDMVLFGHNRLAIIDLDIAANQPFISSDDRYVIVFNGEIYNFIEIRNELSKLGYNFRTQSDTEALLCGYIEWKEKILDKLNGMFSFVVYDKNENEIFLARDRAGIKPLYYFTDNNQLIFSSEISPISTLLGDKCTIDEQSVDIYYTLGYIPAPKTIYREIKKFPAAKYAIFKNGKINFHEYWKPRFESNVISTPLALERIEELLMSSIKLRIRSDVPVGAFLSGGIDSSLVVAYMKKLGVDTSTYTIGFEQNEYDESKYAKKASDIVKTNYNVKILDKSNFENLGQIVNYFGEPFADASAIPMYYVSKFAANDVKVVLSGDGGDELFMGYNGNKSYKFISMYKKAPAFLRTFFEFVLVKVSAYKTLPFLDKVKLLKKIIEDNLDEIILTDIRKKTVIPPEYRKEYHNYKIIAEEWIENHLNERAVKNDYERMIYNDFYMQLPDKLLAKVDRMSMAHSIEARTPFLDYRMIEFAFSLSTTMKMPGFETKYLLKKLSEKFYPKDFIYRSKKGFVPPLNYWINDPNAKNVNSQDRYIDMVFKMFQEEQLR